MDDLITQEEINQGRISDLIKHWKLLKFKMSELDDDKQATERQLRELLDHPELDGSKTYKHDDHSIRITTGLNHTLDKKTYEQIKGTLNPKFDPVKEVVKYEINKKVLRDCLEFGTQTDKYMQSQFIISTPKKLHISIEEPKNEKVIATDFDGDDPFELPTPSSDSN